MQDNNDIIELCDDESNPVAGQVSQSIRAGLPLGQGLIALAEQTSSTKTRNALIKLSKRLDQGMPLADAMRDSQTRLPRSMRALVAAGLETGRLDSIMQYSVVQSQRAASLRLQIWLSLAYPIFLTCFSLMICGLIMVGIIPQFAKIFEDFGVELPGITVAIISLQRALTFAGWTPLVAVIPVSIGLFLVFYLFGQSILGQRWSTSIPLIGLVFRLATLSDFCQLLAILTDTKLPFPKALRCAADASDDRWLHRHCKQLAQEIEDGVTPERAAIDADFPNSLIQVFRHANSGRTFSEALRGMADVYAAQSTVNTRLVSTILEPIAVCFVLGFSGVTTIALFLPLIKLLNDLS